MQYKYFIGYTFISHMIYIKAYNIGGRGQQRPNKGFDCKTLGDFGKNLEFLR